MTRLLLPSVVSLTLLSAGAILAGSALGVRLPLLEITIVAVWTRVLFLVTGAMLVIDGGRVLLRTLLPPSADLQGSGDSERGTRRTRLLSRVRGVSWVGVLVVLTIALPLQGFHVVNGLALFMVLMMLTILLLGFLSVSGALMSTGSLKPAAARWIIPQRTLEKLEAGAGIRGRATIRSMVETGWRVNDDPQVLFELTVMLPDRAPYEARVTEVVPLLAIGSARPGVSVPVIVDADALQHTLIAWKEVLRSG
jgi:hypothetical protein